MKKISLLLLSLMLLLASALPAFAEAPKTASFTHPEMGEFMTIKFERHLPQFSIYGYTYYEILDSETPWRGLTANAVKLVNNKMATVDQALEKLFDSIEGRTEDREPADFMYTGIMDQYDKQLAALPLKERIQAIKILGGFEGVKGYKQLAKLAGFEDVDVKALEESHQEYTVKAGKDKYAYRVLMFHVDEGNWVEYNERYDFLKVSGKWKLARIVKEYTDDYRTRGKYLHGLSGSDPADIQKANEDGLHELTFGMKIKDAAEALNAEAGKNEILLSDTTLFRLPASASLEFKGGNLSRILYTLQSEQAYFSAFISLYNRYADPILVDDKGMMSWSTNDLVITLTPNGDAPTVSYEPYK